MAGDDVISIPYPKYGVICDLLRMRNKIWLVKTFDRLWDSQNIIHLKNLRYV